MIYLAIIALAIATIAAIHIADLRYRISKAKSELQGAKDDLDISDVKHEIKDLQDEIDKADKDRADALAKLLHGEDPGR